MANIFQQTDPQADVVVAPQKRYTPMQKAATGAGLVRDLAAPAADIAVKAAEGYATAQADDFWNGAPGAEEANAEVSTSPVEVGTLDGNNQEGDDISPPDNVTADASKFKMKASAIGQAIQSGQMTRTEGEARLEQSRKDYLRNPINAAFSGLFSNAAGAAMKKSLDNYMTPEEQQAAAAAKGAAEAIQDMGKRTQELKMLGYSDVQTRAIVQRDFKNKETIEQAKAVAAADQMNNSAQRDVVTAMSKGFNDSIKTISDNKPKDVTSNAQSRQLFEAQLNVSFMEYVDSVEATNATRADKDAAIDAASTRVKRQVSVIKDASAMALDTELTEKSKVASSAKMAAYTEAISEKFPAIAFGLSGVVDDKTRAEVYGALQRIYAKGAEGLEAGTIETLARLGVKQKDLPRLLQVLEEANGASLDGASDGRVTAAVINNYGDGITEVAKGIPISPAEAETFSQIASTMDGYPAYIAALFASPNWEASTQYTTMNLPALANNPKAIEDMRKEDRLTKNMVGTEGQKRKVMTSLFTEAGYKLLSRDFEIVPAMPNGVSLRSGPTFIARDAETGERIYDVPEALLEMGAGIYMFKELGVGTTVLPQESNSFPEFVASMWPALTSIFTGEAAGRIATAQALSDSVNGKEATPEKAAPAAETPAPEGNADAEPEPAVAETPATVEEQYAQKETEYNAKRDEILALEGLGSKTAALVKDMRITEAIAEVERGWSKPEDKKRAAENRKKLEALRELAVPLIDMKKTVDTRATYAERNDVGSLLELIGNHETKPSYLASKQGVTEDKANRWVRTYAGDGSSSAFGPYAITGTLLKEIKNKELDRALSDSEKKTLDKLITQSGSMNKANWADAKYGAGGAGDTLTEAEKKDYKRIAQLAIGIKMQEAGVTFGSEMTAEVVDKMLRRWFGGSTKEANDKYVEGVRKDNNLSAITALAN